MNIETFVEENRKKAKKVKADIIKRWNSRVVPRGLDKMERVGAQAYLDSYGKGIAAPKVIDLAICAESMEATAMAAGFWEAAYTLATGETAILTQPGAGLTPTAITAPKAQTQAPTLEGIPSNMQPGKIITMQPIDADHPQSHYILDPAYCGQAKRDGHRNVLFATDKQICHQSRSTAAMAPIREGFEEAAAKAALECGPFILDGERYYLSVLGSEHRTASQAATINIEAGQGTVLPIPVFAAFKALFYKGQDLRKASERERVEAAQYPMAILCSYLEKNGARAEILTTAFTTGEKQALANLQLAEGREGEIWTQIHTTYMEDKGHQVTFRTKYMEEEFYQIIGITKSTAQGRSLASFQVVDKNGKPVGSVGTGFDETTGRKIIEAHEANPGSAQALIKHQGTTESGILWHARLLKVKIPL